MVNLKEYIHPYMDLLFVALNAPENSNINGHWFTNNMSFWNLLYRADIITSPIFNMLEGDEKVFGDSKNNFNNWKIGVTDLNRQDVETDSSKVRVTAEDVHRIENILRNSKVRKVCLMHSKVGEAFRTYSEAHFNDARYGKIGRLEETDIYEVPFHNASVPGKDDYYSLLIQDNSSFETRVSKEKKLKQTPSYSKIDNTSSSEFILPTPGNSITPRDIEKGQLRITVSHKEYFPSHSGKITIKFSGRTKIVSFTKRDGRSDILKMGREFMEKNKITDNSHLKFKYEDGIYYFEILENY